MLAYLLGLFQDYWQQARKDRRYGKPMYEVAIVNVWLEGIRLFRSDGHIPDRPRRSLIRTAYRFADKQWYITEKGFLVLGERKGLSVLMTNLSIDENLDFLFVNEYSLLRGDFAVKAGVLGLSPGDGGGPAGFFWLKFLES